MTASALSQISPKVMQFIVYRICLIPVRMFKCINLKGKSQGVNNKEITSAFHLPKVSSLIHPAEFVKMERRTNIYFLTGALKAEDTYKCKILMVRMRNYKHI
jgi:hypothetical protein